MNYRKDRLKFPCGQLLLEGILTIPEGAGPFPTVIVCHPHPLYGGSMDNNVVDSICDALTQSSLVSFKFNFRGVGQSQGEFSQGTGEREDVEAAISFVTTVMEADSNRIGIAGYSAGASFSLPVAADDTRVKALATISLPLSMSSPGFLKNCSKPKLLICGSSDDFTPPSRFREFCSKLSEPKQCHVIEGADHFWSGYEPELAAKVTAFFTEVL